MINQSKNSLYHEISSTPNQRKDNSFHFLANNTLLTSQQVYKDFLNVSKATFWRMIKAGKFPKGIKITEVRYGWPLEEVEAWLEAKKAERILTQ